MAAAASNAIRLAPAWSWPGHSSLAFDEGTVLANTAVSGGRDEMINLEANDEDRFESSFNVYTLRRDTRVLESFRGCRCGSWLCSRKCHSQLDEVKEGTMDWLPR